MWFIENFRKILLTGKNAATLGSGLWMTMKIALLSALIGTLLGALLCRLRTGRFKATPHRTAARQAMPFPPSALSNFLTCNQQARKICKRI